VKTYTPASLPSARRLAADAHVLVAEDSDIGQLLAASTLAKLGFTNIDAAYDGQQAVESYKHHTHDLILLDCQMPVLDGFQVAQRIRQDGIDSSHHVPIIAVTASTDVTDHAKARRAGMDDVIVKPLLVHILLPIVRRWFDVAANHTMVGSDSGPLCEADQLHMFTQGDGRRKQRIMGLFFNQATAALRDLHAALAAGDAEAWCFTAHRLKGAAMNVAVTEIVLLSTQAEAAPTATREEKQRLLMMLADALRRVQIVQQ